MAARRECGAQVSGKFLCPRGWPTPHIPRVSTAQQMKSPAPRETGPVHLCSGPSSKNHSPSMHALSR